MTNILLAFMREDGLKAGQLMCAPRATSAGSPEAPQEAPKAARGGSTETAAAGAAAGAAQEANVAAFCAAIADVVARSHQTPFFDKFGAYVADICGLACTHKVQELKLRGVTFGFGFYCLISVAKMITKELSTHRLHASAFLQPTLSAPTHTARALSAAPPSVYFWVCRCG
jgi:hypothetical protein